MSLLRQNHVRYGLILAGITFICLTLMLLTNSSYDQQSPINVAMTFLFPAVVWYLGIKTKRKELKGKLTFKQGVTEGFKMSVVYAIVSPFIFLLFYTLNPTLLEYVKQAYGMTNLSNSIIIAADMFAQFVAAIIGGTVYGAIISLFLKTK